MTKEMRPSHRIDGVSDAILHYSQHCKETLGSNWSIQPKTINNYLNVHVVFFRPRKSLLHNILLLYEVCCLLHFCHKTLIILNIRNYIGEN